MSRQRLTAVLLPAALVPAAFILTLTAMGRAAYGRSACEVPAAYPTVQSAIDDPTCEAIMVAPGTYGEHLTVGRSLSIHGAEGAILDGGGSGRVVTAGPGLVLTLTGLTIQNGAADLGAGVYLTNSTLIADHMGFADNVATGPWVSVGGAIFMDGSPATTARLTVTKSAFLRNAADDGGGAIDFAYLAHAFLQDVAFIGNHAELGGAVVLGGYNTLERAYFEDNSADGGGGAMAVFPSRTTISSSVFFNNHATSAGAIALAGYIGDAELAIQHSTLMSNTAAETAGAISAGRAVLSIIDSTIVGNQAADGGAIATYGSRVTIKGSTIISNAADSRGGGVYSNPFWYISYVDLVNSTMTGNAAGEMGGAIFSHDVLSLTHSTVYGNSSLVGGGIAGGDWVTGTATLNSIIAGNQGGDCARWIGSIGYNLDGDNTCSFDQPTDLPGVDPLLGPLGYYGGATQSFPLLPGSPAIDTGPEEGCLPVDQRGFPRPRDGDGDGDARCDRGAHEVWVPEFRLTLPLLRRPLAK